MGERGLSQKEGQGERSRRRQETGGLEEELKILNFFFVIVFHENILSRTPCKSE
jgi:hypothetical protein